MKTCSDHTLIASGNMDRPNATGYTFDNKKDADLMLETLKVLKSDIKSLPRNVEDMCTIEKIEYHRLVHKFVSMRTIFQREHLD